MMKTLVRWHKVSSQPGIPDGMTHRFKSCQPDVLAGAETPLTTSDSREGSSRLSSGGTFSSLLPDDIDRDLHRRNRSPVLEPVGRVPILGPAHSRPIIRSDPVSMVSDRSLQDVHGARSAFVVVNRAEDASRLDGHHTHSKLAPLHALDLRAKVNRCKQLHRNTLRLRCHLFVAHRALLSVRPGLSRIGRPFRRARRSDRGDTRPSWIRSRVVEHAPRSFSRVAATSRPERVVAQPTCPDAGGQQRGPVRVLVPAERPEPDVMHVGKSRWDAAARPIRAGRPATRMPRRGPPERGREAPPAWVGRPCRRVLETWHAWRPSPTDRATIAASAAIPPRAPSQGAAPCSSPLLPPPPPNDRRPTPPTGPPAAACRSGIARATCWATAATRWIRSSSRRASRSSVPRRSWGASAGPSSGT